MPLFPPNMLCSRRICGLLGPRRRFVLRGNVIAFAIDCVAAPRFLCGGTTGRRSLTDRPNIFCRDVRARCLGERNAVAANCRNYAGLVAYLHIEARGFAAAAAGFPLPMTDLSLPFGLAFADLYDRDGLVRLDRAFVAHLAAADVGAARPADDGAARSRRRSGTPGNPTCSSIWRRMSRISSASCSASRRRSARCRRAITSWRRSIR